MHAKPMKKLTDTANGGRYGSVEFKLQLYHSMFNDFYLILCSRERVMSSTLNGITSLPFLNTGTPS